jgi:hypothetical protein
MRNAPRSPRSAIVRHLSRLSDLQLGAQRAETGHSAAKVVHFRNAGHRSRLASIACGPFQERSSRNPTRMGRSSGLLTTWRFYVSNLDLRLSGTIRHDLQPDIPSPCCTVKTSFQPQQGIIGDNWQTLPGSFRLSRRAGSADYSVLVEP